MSSREEAMGIRDVLSRSCIDIGLRMETGEKRRVPGHPERLFQVLDRNWARPTRTSESLYSRPRTSDGQAIIFIEGHAFAIRAFQGCHKRPA